MSHEFQFRASTPDNAQKWYEAIRSCAGQTSNELPESDGSPNASRQASANYPQGETAHGAAYPTEAGTAGSAPGAGYGGVAQPTEGTTAGNAPGAGYGGLAHPDQGATTGTVAGPYQGVGTYDKA